VTTTLWILGFIAGLAALVLIHLLLIAGIALVVAVSLLRPRPAATAGACVAWGLGFLVALKQGADRCVEFDQQPNAACSMGNNTPFAATGIAVLVLGIVLTAYAVWRGRVVAVPSAP
jgi:hypothetical protein